MFGMASFAGKRIMTISGIMQLNAPNINPSGQLYDLVRAKGASSGQFAVVQLNNGTAPGYAINIETNPGGSTAHSPKIDVTPGGTYWFSFQVNFTGGTARLSLYQAPSWTLIGSTTATQTVGEDIDVIHIGNAEVGASAGSFNYFQSLIFTYSTNVYPQGP
jgi:hypothetical protein